MQRNFDRTTFRRPDKQILFAVRYADGTSEYIRVPPSVGMYGASPAVLKLALAAQAKGEIRSGEIASIVRVR